MGLSVSLLLILSGVCLYAGFHHLMVWRKLRQEWAHVGFGVGTLFAAGYIGLSAALYQTPSTTLYALEVKAQAVMAFGCFGWMAWFVGHYTGYRPRPLLVAISLMCVGLAIWNLTLPYGLWYASLEGLARHRMFWGEWVVLPEATSDWHALTDTAMELLLTGYVIAAVWRQHRRGQREAARALGLAIGLLMTTALVDVVHDLLGWKTLYIAEFGFVSLVLLMGDRLTTVHRDLTLALRRTVDALQAEAAELREARDALADSEARFRAVVDHAADPILIHTPQGRIVHANRAAREAFGYDGPAMTGLDLRTLEADPAPEGKRSLPGLRESLTAMRTYRRADGATFRAEVRMRQLRLGGEELVIALARDVSARERLEQHLRESERLEMVARLAGGIAHEFNNVLQVVQASGELALTQVPSSSPAAAGLSASLRATDRAARLVRQLLAFSQQQLLTVTEIEPGEIAAAVAERLREKVGKGVAVSLHRDSGQGSVRGDRRQLVQVLMSLCDNSRAATEAGGEIRLSSGYVELTADDCALEPRAKPGRYAVLAVRDTGCGMDSETLRRALDPFYSTREVGEGRGLGLAAARGTVEQHGGLIRVSSEPGQGTLVQVLLPVADPASGTAAPGSARP